MNIIRSRRKTIAVEVHPDGRVIVRAPLRASQLQIEQFVASKESWIRKKLAEKARQAERTPHAHTFTQGEHFLYLGDLYPLVLVERQSQALILDGSFYLRRADQPQAARVFETWYKAQARRVFTARLGELARLYGFKFNKLRLSSARTRWGSCSSKGTISLSWRLALAPPQIIDYVIVHELVHLLEHNHSARYWARVEVILPDYRARRKWLKDNAQLLTIN